MPDVGSPVRSNNPDVYRTLPDDEFIGGLRTISDFDAFDDDVPLAARRPGMRIVSRATGEERKVKADLSGLEPTPIDGRVTAAEEAIDKVHVDPASDPMITVVGAGGAAVDIVDALAGFVAGNYSLRRTAKGFGFVDRESGAIVVEFTLEGGWRIGGVGLMGGEPGGPMFSVRSFSGVSIDLFDFLGRLIVGPYRLEKTAEGIRFATLAGDVTFLTKANGLRAGSMGLELDPTVDGILLMDGNGLGVMQEGGTGGGGSSGDVAALTAAFDGRGGFHNLDRMRRCRMKAARLLCGETLEADGSSPLKLRLALVADSKTDRSGWTWRATRRWRELFGDGGCGTIRLFGGIASAPAAESSIGAKAYNITTSGTWSVTEHGAPSALLTSGTATGAASVTVNALASVSTQSTVGLLYAPRSGAQARWRKNGGTWTTLNLSAGYIQPLVGATFAAGDAIEIERVAGTVELSGLYGETAGPGIVVQKLALGGSQLVTEWAPAAAGDAAFAAQLGAIAPDGVVIKLGTNDTGQTAAAVAAAATSLIEDLRAIVPWPGDQGLDVCVVADAVYFGNPLGLKMAEFAAALRDVAEANDAAFRDIQDVFALGAGNDPSAYADLWDGGKHETEPDGMATVAAAMIPLLTI